MTLPTRSAPSSPRHAPARSSQASDDWSIGKSKQVVVYHRGDDGKLYEITLYNDAISPKALKKSAEAILAVLPLQNLHLNQRMNFCAVDDGIEVSGDVDNQTIDTNEAKELAQILISKKNEDRRLTTFAETYQKTHTVAQKILAPPPPPKAAAPDNRPAVSVPRKQGLINLGNSCFLNAILQLFPQEIRRELLKCPQAFKTGKKHPLYVVFEKYESGRTIAKSDLFDLHTRTGMRMGKQADAHEALCKLAEDIQLEPLLQNQSPLVAAAKTWHTTNVALTPPVEWASNAKIEQQFIGRRLIVPEEGIDVETLLENQLIDKEANPEFRIGGEKVPVKTKIAFETAPNYLLVQIKRDRPVQIVDPKDSKRTITQNKKDHTKVHVKTDLHLSAEATNDKTESTYRLAGFTIHIPSLNAANADSGHWVAYRLEGDKWYRFDDQKDPEPIDDLARLCAAAGEASQLMYIKNPIPFSR